MGLRALPRQGAAGRAGLAGASRKYSGAGGCGTARTWPVDRVRHCTHVADWAQLEQLLGELLRPLTPNPNPKPNPNPSPNPNPNPSPSPNPNPNPNPKPSP
eukprot:scaffold12305_cov59-Phaeocystis_antarctica.AAC.2